MITIKELDITIKELRNLTGMTRVEFSKFLYNIPYRTVEDWEKSRGPKQKYLVELIIYKLVNEGLIDNKDLGR